MDREELSALVSQSCGSMKDVAAVYLFGSRAKNKSNPDDYDFAVLFEETMDVDKIEQDMRLDSIHSLLERRLGKVDVIRLNDADLVLTQQVLKYKKLLYCRNNTYRVHWETQARYRIWDYLPIYVRYRDAAFARICERAKELDRYNDFREASPGVEKDNEAPRRDGS